MDVSQYLTTTYNAWLWLAGEALVLMGLLVGIVYVFGSFLMNDKMKGWARLELSEIFYSAVILIVAAFVIQSNVISDIMELSLDVGDAGLGGRPARVWLPVKTDQLIGNADREVELDLCENDGGVRDVGTWRSSPYYGVYDCHMRLAIYYLDTIFHETTDYAFGLYMDYIWSSMAAEFSINVEFLFEMSGMMTFTPWRGFFTMPNTIMAQCFDYAIKVMMLNQFQIGMLRFIAVALYPVLFVVGVVLRTMSFTRRLGGLLLAMAISLYFIFPAFYAFGALVVIDMKTDSAILDDWLASPMNAAGTHNPPIANSLYMLGDIPMIGGEGHISTAEAREQYLELRSMESEDALEAISAGRTSAGGTSSGLLPSFDFTPDTDITPEERALNEQRLLEARTSAQSWFDTISNQNLLQRRFVTMAYQNGGTIDILSRLTFFSAFFSLFSILGTIAAIRSLSMTFGGDIEIAGLTRLI